MGLSKPKRDGRKYGRKEGRDFPKGGVGLLLCFDPCQEAEAGGVAQGTLLTLFGTGARREQT